MANNLTNSYRDRQTILNNSYLIQKIEVHFNFEEFFDYGRLVKNSLLMTKRQLSCILKTHKNTIDRYITTHSKELKQSGYEILTGEALGNFLAKCGREVIFSDGNRYGFSKSDRPITKFEIFTFKSWLNMAMLLPESEPAKFVRSRILDIAIDLAAQEDGKTKYINRKIQYVYLDVYREFIYCSQEFKNATQQYIKLDRNELTADGIKRISQYDLFAMSYDNIYQLVFGNLHSSYKQAIVLHTVYKKRNLEKLRRESSFCRVTPGSKLRDAIYHEVYRVMNQIENGIAIKIELVSINKGRKLEIEELDDIVSHIEQDIKFLPLIQEARIKMALIKSLDANPELYKEVLNERFREHEQAIKKSDIDKFVEVKLKNLKEKLLMAETLAVFQRLSDRDNER